MTAAKVRCPECRRSVRVDGDGRMERHARAGWAVLECVGSVRSCGEILIAREQKAVEDVRGRERQLRSKIEDAKASIERWETELAALPKEIAKAEKKLEALRKKLAKDGDK